MPRDCPDSSESNRQWCRSNSLTRLNSLDSLNVVPRSRANHYGSTTKQSESSKSGAKIQEKIKRPLAEKTLLCELADGGGLVRISCGDDGLTIEATSRDGRRSSFSEATSWEAETVD